MTTKNIVRLLILVPLSIYLIFCTYFFFTHSFNPTYEDCGKVISKSSDEISIKHGTRTELYLNIQFNKTGFKSVECEPTTYFSKNIGDNVCFDLNKDFNRWYSIKMFTGYITLIILGTIGLIILILYLFSE